jgi:hypothetical protein
LGVTIAWVFFRAENIQQATLYILNMFKHPGSFLLFNVYLKYLFLLIIIPLFLLAEWQGKHKEYAIESLPDKMPKPLRYTFYYILGAIIIWFGDKEVQFIYFQF